MSSDKAHQKKSNFGLLDRSYPTDLADSDAKIWHRFEKYVKSKADEAKEGESFKVLFLGRHGQGWHNVAETKYGTKAWDVRLSDQIHPYFPPLTTHIYCKLTIGSATGQH